MPVPRSAARTSAHCPNGGARSRYSASTNALCQTTWRREMHSLGKVEHAESVLSALALALHAELFFAAKTNAKTSWRGTRSHPPHLLSTMLHG